MKFYLGCAVWSHKGWVGNFYPSGSKSQDFLRLYSQRLTAVEGNTTFYAVPDSKTITRWRNDTPVGFQFCPKLPRDITHQGLLQPRTSEALAFAEKMSGLGDRLGPIFAQLPPNYGPTFLEDLSLFVQAWDEKYSLALEVRHPDWFQEPHASQLKVMLEQFGVGRVLLDTRPIYNCPDDPQISSERRKPKLPVQPQVTANFTIIRFISHPQKEFNQSFLEEWVSLVKQWLEQEIQVYFFVHCPVEDYSPQTAKYFQAMLEKESVAVPPLPWNQLNSSPIVEQLSLF